MTKLLIDTGAFFAQRDPSDQHHSAAVRGFSDLAEAGVKLYTTEHILDETLTLIARRESYAYASETGTELTSSGVLQWLTAGPDDWATAIRFMRKYSDQAVSFTDCLSFALMKRASTKHVFGFDRHFQAAGFRLWPAAR